MTHTGLVIVINQEFCVYVIKRNGWLGCSSYIVPVPTRLSQWVYPGECEGFTWNSKTRVFLFGGGGGGCQFVVWWDTACLSHWKIFTICLDWKNCSGIRLVEFWELVLSRVITAGTIYSWTKLLHIFILNKSHPRPPQSAKKKTHYIIFIRIIK
jgi:hypothetical protein